MSKVKAKIMEVLADGNWHSSSEIVDIVSRSLATRKEKIWQAMSDLTGAHMLEKEHCSEKLCRYRAKPAPMGFGISPQLYQFQQLISQARAR